MLLSQGLGVNALVTWGWGGTSQERAFGYWALANFHWRLIGIDGFATVDPLRGLYTSHRRFNLRWLGSEADEAMDTLADRRSYFSVGLEVRYPRELRDGEAHSQILADRHSVLTALRDPAGYRGVSDNEAFDVGMRSRTRVGDEIDEIGEDWVYRSEWRCLVHETA